jgi:hypothetical protein
VSRAEQVLLSTSLVVRRCSPYVVELSLNLRDAFELHFEVATTLIDRRLQLGGRRCESAAQLLELGSRDL